MTFEYGSGQRGRFTKGMVNGWDWKRNGGSYELNRDFFSVHWEVHDHDPNSVKLHVEAPRLLEDQTLNRLKGEVLASLAGLSIDCEIRSLELGVVKGRRLGTGQIEGNKSTEAFRVVLPSARMRSTHEENLREVHTLVGASIEAVLTPFLDELNGHFR